MFKVAFEFLTEPLGLPIAWYWEYIILVMIGLIPYTVFYEKVGNLYSVGLISGRTSGSFFHWLFRFVIFAVIWAFIFVFILLIKFVLANLLSVILAIGSIAVLSCVIQLLFVICYWRLILDKTKSFMRNI